MNLFPKSIYCAVGPGRHTLFILITCLSCATLGFAQTRDQGITAIERLSRQINEQIAESERGEESHRESNGIYCNELVVNKGNKSWPAVGVYRTVVNFYYTFGDREKNPYPDRLLKISVTTNRSDREEHAEYMFNPAGQLIFYYEKDSENPRSDRRYYFASDRLIRRMTGSRVVDIRGREALEAVKSVLFEKIKLQRFFLNSLVL